MSVAPAFLIHYVIGAITILCWWGAFLSVKGSPRHRRFGRRFLVALGLVLASVFGMLFLSNRAYDAAGFIQFGYLSLCVVTVGSTAFLAIRLRNDVARFRGPWFRTLGIASFLMGGVVLAAGIAARDPMPLIFSVIGLLYGGAMIRFAWFRGALHPNWWLGWHLNGMTFLFNAIHGTFLAQIWLAAIGGAPTTVSAVAQIATMGVSLGLRLHFGRRFDAPLRFRAPPTVAAAYAPAANHA